MKATVLVALSLLTCSKIFAFTVEERMAITESFVLESKGDYENAAKKVNHVYNANKMNYFLNLRLGSLLSYAKKYKNSIEHYKNAAKIFPHALDPWLALSLLYMNLLDYNNALDASSEILKRDPMNYLGLLRTCTILVHKKAYKEALPKVEEALRLYPLDLTFLEQKGLILMTLEKKMDEAKEALNLLLVLSPQNAYAKSVLKN